MHYPIKTVFILFITLVSTTSKAQPEFEPQVEPKPYLGVPHFGYIIKTGIKTVSVISTDVSKASKADTIFIYNYNKEGKKYQEKKFDRKGNADVYYFEYYGQKLSCWWVNEYPLIAPRKNIVFHEYNKDSNIVATKHYWIKKNGDTIYKSYNNYRYDKDKKLISKNDSTDKRLSIYHYQNSNLTKTLVYVHPENKKNYNQIEYRYSEDNLLLEKTERQFIDTVIYLLNKHTYHYNSLKQLIKENYSGVSFEGISTVVDYQYNNEKKLSKMSIVRGNFYMYVTYTYNHGKIIEINVETNSWKASSNEFHIPMSSFLSPASEVPIKYKELYTYDNSGNLIEKRHLLNEEVKMVNKYQIEYY